MNLEQTHLDGTDQQKIELIVASVYMCDVELPREEEGNWNEFA